MAKRVSKSRARPPSSSTPTATRRRSRCCATRAERLRLRGRGRRPGWRELAGRGGVRRAAAVPGLERRGARLSRRRSRGSHDAGGARDHGHRSAARWRCWRRPASSAPTSRSAAPSASACRWATAARTRRSSPPATSYKRLDAGPHHRRLERRRRPAGAAHGAADPRAAHPPREGDQQHLHRAGAARGHGRDVRRLPRARRACAGSPRRVHRLAAILAAGLRRLGIEVGDAAVLRHAHRAASRAGPRRSLAAGARQRASTCAWSTPTTSASRSTRPPRAPRSQRSGRCFAGGAGPPDARASSTARSTTRCPRRCARTSAFLDHPVFHRYHSETEMLRYLRRLQDKDLALDRSDDPARLVHHEAQRDHRDDPGDLAGVRARCIRSRRAEQARRLPRSCSPSSRLCSREITGFAAVSLQPNAGSQGEYAGPARDPRLPPGARRGRSATSA